ncbi:HD domain-containing phosphohydrolase [Inhella gelatinilytica]|uniref:Metal-dependent phosphohydrolase n=1 Tax=Inhella gelatinilytica TaxID=2795030 RepID=A0A931NAC8_9BURK|nr:HD domain-containing phosphohydrolase [Inhella gelatinilytica]MBH9552333.1 metal-dependent phosphohydrolase [Inhella gelatinilytica]
MHPSSSAPRWWARPPQALTQLLKRGLGLRVLLASLVVACMVVMATAQLGINVWQGRDRFTQDAQRSAQQASQLIEERMRGLLQPGATVVRQVGFDPLASATHWSARLARAHVLTAELDANPLLAALYVGYTDGEFFLARPLRTAAERTRFEAPAAAAYLLQTQDRDRDGAMQGRYHYLDSTGQLLVSQERPTYRYDPRTRDWWAPALAQPGLAVSAPYLFFTTRSAGLTLSQRSREGGAVVGADLQLQDLSRTLGGLRSTRGTQMALMNAQGQVLAFTEAARLETRVGDKVRLATVADLGAPALAPLQALTSEQAHTFTAADGEAWVGIRLALEVGLGPGVELLAVTPLEDLVAPARARAHRARWIATGLALLLLPVGWWAGSLLARRLDQLSERTQRLTHFDFRPAPLTRSPVCEVNELNQAIERMGGTIGAFLRLSEQMATEPETERMLQQVLDQLVQATHCSAAQVFLWHRDAQQMQHAASAGAPEQVLPEAFAYPSGRPARQTARGEGRKQMDLELHGRDGRLQGLLVLEFPADEEHGDPAFVSFARQLSGMLAVAIETRQLIKAQRQLFDAVIRLMADAIDAKSPYTGGHCDRVPRLATTLVERLCAEQEGPFASFQLSEAQRYAFRLGAWLHDCGKVTSPEHIVDKATKLELIYNRIHEVRTRFEILWRDMEMAALRGELDTAALHERQRQLREDFAFVAQCNVGGEFLADAAIERLHRIGAQTWLRHFDDRLGLSEAEASRLQAARPEAPPLPAPEPLLADRPEHRVPWGETRPPVAKDDPRNRYGFDMRLPEQQQHQGELHNLSVRRGTLTDEDRFRINDHIVQTYIMLKGLPWPEDLARVPEYAASHHEKLDGQGYPRRLGADQLGVEDRVMALADVFEALTSADRPYKTPKTLNETLRIMVQMCRDRHLDPALFRYFLHSRLWDEFAAEFLLPEQRDAVDMAGLLALLPESDPVGPKECFAPSQSPAAP